MAASVVESGDVFDEEGLWEKVSHTWVIEEIESNFKAEIEELSSPQFYNKKRYAGWRIDLSCPISDVRDLGYLDLTLNAILIPNGAIETKYVLSVRDSGDIVIKSVSEQTCFTKEEDSWLYDHFMLWSDLLPSIPDKTLKIRVEILIKIHTFDKTDHVIVLGADSPEVRLQKGMNELFESSKYADVVFEVEESRLKAHEVILSARSTVFAAMFADGHIEDHSDGAIKIVGFQSHNFKRFLRFVYSGKVDIPCVEDALELFRAGEKYGFPDLKSLCKNFMSLNLTSSNVGSILLFAETFTLEDLKKPAMDYMLKNIKCFCNTEMEVYKQLEKENPKLLTELLVMVAQKIPVNVLSALLTGSK